jgi:hypothetical protein
MDRAFVAAGNPPRCRAASDTDDFDEIETAAAGAFPRMEIDHMTVALWVDASFSGNFPSG